MGLSAVGEASVFLIEDDPYLANSIGQLLSLISGLTYKGFTTSGRDGVQFCRDQHPTIVLLDLWLPDGDGIFRISELAALKNPPQILILTGRCDDVTLHAAWFGPVAGLVWKNAGCEINLKLALESIIRGRRFFPADVLAAISRFRSASDAFHKILSRREQALMLAFGRGDSDQQIGDTLKLSPATVHVHRNHIMWKLGIHHRSELMTWAMQKGFASPVRPAPPGQDQKACPFGPPFDRH